MLSPLLTQQRCHSLTLLPLYGTSDALGLFPLINHWRYGSLICITTLIIHVRVQRGILPVLYGLHSRDSAVVSISTGHVIPLSCTISMDYHSRYYHLICIMPLIIQIRVQYLTDHIIKLNTMEMRSLRS